jgi:RNase P subunit RPR2
MATTRYQQTNWSASERTSIEIIPSKRKATCHNCHVEVTPNKIDTAHLSKPLHVCPRCRSVIQANNYIEERTS